MKERTYTISGVAPLVMHNERLADPLDKWTKLVAEISSKRKKTDDDYKELGRREWFGGLYLNAKQQPIVPERCLERMLRDGAVKEKRGKDVQAALIVFEPAIVVYKGPKDIEELYAAGPFVLRATVGVSGKRVVRSRPMFPEWSLSFTVNYDEAVLNERDIDRFLETAGRLVGLMEWRPKYGRFTVEKAA